MKAEELIRKAREQGITFVPAPGGRFAVRGPKVPALAEELRKHREEVLEHLKKELERQARVGAKMLEERGVLLIRSHRLGKVVAVTAKDPPDGKIPQDAVTFTLEETREIVQKLRNPDAASLVCIFKEVFGGTVLEVRDLPVNEAQEPEAT